MKLFTELNQVYDYDYLTPFWLHRSLILEKALEILYETIIIGNTFEMIGNTKKYLQHIKTYNAWCDGLKKSESVIEWGGGLGRMADIIKRKYKNIKTYIIIDIPIMSYIQYRYFTFKKIPVNIITSFAMPITQGINLVSLPYIEIIKLYPDMFISTWAISESGKKSLEYCSRKRLFDCKHLLIAHNKHEQKEFPDSPLYGIINCIKQDIDEDNQYIFK